MHSSQDAKREGGVNRIDPCIKEALLYRKIDEKVKCICCERSCEILPGGYGFCGTRKNMGGKLYTLEYGDISSLSANPIEKKPFFHFYPGSRALTVGSWSCNFTCPWCQNWEISKCLPDPDRRDYLPPENFVRLLKERKCQGTSISFNEPTLLFEYALDVFDLARREKFYNTYVTNGYMSSETLRSLIAHGLDAINFDVKGDAGVVKKYCNADVEKVWRNIKEARKLGVHVEITTLLIPGLDDDDESLKRIARKIREIGDYIPWHITRYHPAYKAFEVGFDRRTPIETLERAWKIGKGEGLSYVYIGNVPGHRYENTYCPSCGELLIKRLGYDIIAYKISKEKRCPRCGKGIPIVGEYVE